MTPRQADKLIKAGKVVTLKNRVDTITGIPVERDRRTISIEYEWEGKKRIGKFWRDDLELV